MAILTKKISLIEGIKKKRIKKQHIVQQRADNLANRMQSIKKKFIETEVAGLCRPC